MTSTISDEFQAVLDTGATHLARCWKLNRNDGVTLGFTDHDLDLSFDGTLFRASAGMNASAIEVSTGLSVDNAHAVGALSADSLKDEDILAGRYDGAEILHWLVDWQNLENRVLLFRGTLGEMRQTNGAFEVELRGLAEKMNRPLGRAFVKTCDRELGDHKCGFDLSTPGYSHDTVVATAISNASIVADDLSTFATGWFSNGMVSWKTGANAGLNGLIKQDVVLSDVRHIELWEEAPFKVETGDQFRLIAGCDKRAATCRKKFDNFLNFRGFPHIPGEDWVTAYPRRGEVHDGSSMGWIEHDFDT